MTTPEDFRALSSAASDWRATSARTSAAVTSDLRNVGAQLRAVSEDSRQLSRSFSGDLGRAFDSMLFKGTKLSDALRGLALDVSRTALSAALKPVQNAFASILSNAVPGFAQGAAFEGGRIRAFASGGVVGAPTLFPMRSGLGLMGEAGPEAIMPLQRGADGRLGVAAEGGGRARSPHVTINISTPDVEGFRRSETQIAAAMRRLAARGGRNL
ncbi:phage tail tape measure protein [Neomegalonema sp.]|uniref:phage tail tape measure protein n=1 Tax=Neomegalonema sp. TaxID=2039713 RepID=UPI002620F52C|nr:phage tail tape measure protein [Neomegalonema sp.]MDD2869102.1 phage tail tape measure protein [Neomegalonema sp.]